MDRYIATCLLFIVMYIVISSPPRMYIYYWLVFFIHKLLSYKIAVSRIYYSSYCKQCYGCYF